MAKITQFCKDLIHHPLFDQVILGIVVFNGILIGLETSPSLFERHSDLFHLINHAILTIFILEAVIKMTAEAPHIYRYFKQGWNVFDFTIIVLAFLPAGEFATLARLIRVLRIARIITVVPELRLIIFTLMRSLPGMAHIVMLLAVLFYIYGVTGYYLFHTIDPENWGNLGKCLLTLFGIVTLETWVDKMGVVLPQMPYAWIYFVSFIVLGTFTFINLFVAVVINNLSEAKEEKLKELQEPVSKEELLKELKTTQEALLRLEARLNDRYK